MPFWGTISQNLYVLGARKFGIISIPPLGCCPAVRAMNGGECSVQLNQSASVFYNATSALFQRLSYELKDFNYSLANSFAMTATLLQDPSLFQINDTVSACCGIGKLNGEGACYKAMNASLCEKRDGFLFWDWFHPTDKVSGLAASILYGGAPNFVSPINFGQLARI